MDRNFVIGLDCGASHSRVVVWDGNKEILSISDLSGLNPDVVNSSLIVETLSSIFKELIQYPYAKWVIGMAGLDDNNEIVEANVLVKRVFQLSGTSYSKFVVFSDIDLVLWAGGNSGSGIGLVAGTGSNCLGRNIYGETFKVGGMSHMLSDEGAGFSLGWRCLHLVTKMFDGRAEKTVLIDEVLRLYQCSSLVNLKNRLVKSVNMKADVAKCAEILLSACDRGEIEAMEICSQESLELVRMVATINSNLKSEELLPVFLAGSLFRNKNYLDLFKIGLAKYFPSQKITLVNPVHGALVFANITP